MALVPSWLAIADRTLADNAHLLADVRVRRAHVSEQWARILQRPAQRRAIITSENALPGRTKSGRVNRESFSYAARPPGTFLLSQLLFVSSRGAA